MGPAFGPRRACWIDAPAAAAAGEGPLSAAELALFETLDLLYRSLCALLFNYVPTSGHPGGSISAGRFTAALLFDALDYDLADPERDDADILSYAAGHKAMGLYAMWALRDEIARLGAPRAPAGRRPAAAPSRGSCSAFAAIRPPPLRCFAPCALGRSTAIRHRPHPSCDSPPAPPGVGLASSIGLAIAARDRFGADCPIGPHLRR